MPRTRVTHAEVIALCIAQALLDCRADEQLLAIARHRLRDLFPHLPERSAFHKRRLRLSAVRVVPAGAVPHRIRTTDPADAWDPGAHRPLPELRRLLDLGHAL